MTTEEGNKLIAEFMGFDYDRSLPGFGGTIIKTLGIEDCRYHTSWDWLMPVVEKIEHMSNSGFGFIMQINMVEIINYQEPNHPCVVIIHQYDKETRIELLYDAVIEFIQWYNQTE